MLDAPAVADMFIRVLAATHLSTPDQVGMVLADSAAMADLLDLKLFLVDLEQAHLVPLPVGGAVTGDGGVLRIEGTVAGRSFSYQQIIPLAGCSANSGLETLMASVDGSSLDDPLMGLAGDLGNEFEVGVVMQHGQVPSLSCRCD